MEWLAWSSPYDSFSTVPTTDERGGEFFRGKIQRRQPRSNLQSTDRAAISIQRGNECDGSGVDQFGSDALLNYIPLPNIGPTASGQNFHYVTSAASSSDTVIFRLVHNFGASNGSGLGPFGGGGGGGGGGGRRRAQNNINFGLNWSRSSNNIVNQFPSLAGGTGTQGLNASAGGPTARAGLQYFPRELQPQSCFHYESLFKRHGRFRAGRSRDWRNLE